MSLIDADAVCKTLESYEIKETIGKPLTDWEYGYTCGIERAESEIECAPTVDAEPVRHGTWKKVGPYRWGTVFECSECGEQTTETVIGKPRYEYCPMCGAKMDGKRPEE